jgi:hypothetical protein
MSKRTDIHRPSAINPAEYTFIACIFYGEPGMNIEAVRTLRAHMDRTGAKFAHIERESGGCDICGARCVNVAKFYHEPSNTYITTGLDCAEKLDMGDPIEFRSFRKRIAAGLKTMRGKRKAQELLSGHNLQAAWDIYVADSERRSQDYDGPVSAKVPAQELTICDIIHKVVKYGNISDAQVGYVRNLLARIAERPALEAQRAAEIAAAAPVPEAAGRMKVAGKVLSKRVEETQFGQVTKILVQHETGYKLWGSKPTGLTVQVGDTVEFIARVERSDKDTKFGFFSRPTKAVVTARLFDEADHKGLENADYRSARLGG